MTSHLQSKLSLLVCLADLTSHSLAAFTDLVAQCFFLFQLKFKLSFLIDSCDDQMVSCQFLTARKILYTTD